MNTQKGVALWNKAKKIIPGGNQLLSKRPERFLPDFWPCYFSKAKGVEVWDLDGRKFIDMSLMGVGTCILGYADEDVNKAVKEVIETGSMCTLNSPEEVELTDLLLDLHPWAAMARYARTGGEAMAIAVRLARAYTGRDKVCFCGYHGWSDWYLSANLADDKNLDGHLLPGLQPKGVPRGLKGTALPFRYNKIEELEGIVKEQGSEIAAIVMEPRREHEPQKGFLESVRKIADKIGAVLIFDEITSGWRMRLGGIHNLYNVFPDIVVYAKAISNGFPMAAIVGKKKFMDIAQDTFISSTYWTEAIGFAAALATINKLKVNDVPGHLRRIGNLINQGWLGLAKKHGLPIEVLGVPSLTSFKFKHSKKDSLRTLFTQEMLDRGFLASDTIYVSWSHTQEHVKRYLAKVDEVFAIIKRAVQDNNIEGLLKGPVSKKGFQRLT